MKTATEILESKRKHLLTITDYEAILAAMEEYANQVKQSVEQEVKWIWIKASDFKFNADVEYYAEIRITGQKPYRSLVHLIGATKGADNEFLTGVNTGFHFKNQGHYEEIYILEQTVQTASKEVEESELVCETFGTKDKRGYPNCNCIPTPSKEETASKEWEKAIARFPIPDLSDPDWGSMNEGDFNKLRIGYVEGYKEACQMHCNDGLGGRKQNWMDCY